MKTIGRVAIYVDLALTAAWAAAGPPAETGARTGIVRMSRHAQGRHTCAAKEDSTVYCWESDLYGQLGDGKANSESSTPVKVAGLDTVVSVAAGFSHTCALTANDSVWCCHSQAGTRFGDSLTAWNLGRNEVSGFLLRRTADLSIGAPLQSADGVSGAGAVNLLYGSFISSGFVNANPNIWNGDTTNLGGPLAGAHFGAALY